MNRTVPNAKNWPDQKKPKHGGIRVIDRGTNYDTLGKFRRVLRQMEKGDVGEIRGFALSIVTGSGEEIRYKHAMYGPASMSELRAAATSLAKWANREDQL